MDEYDFLNRILDQHYLSPNPEQLEEEGVQTAEIITKPGDKGLEGYSLYRYSLIEEDFLPFFNDNHDTAPKDLKSFCDYILLVPYRGTLYVMLIELKKNNDTVKVQIDATRQFLDYVISTAERIKDKNKVSFDSDKIKTIRIKLRGIPVKNSTKHRNDLSYEKSEDLYTYKSKKFDILYVCDYYERNKDKIIQ